MNDQYNILAKYYDDFVKQNRDYHKIAVELSKIIGDAKSLLDVGIGTGLVVEHLLQIQPSYQIIGVDTSRPLLDQAEQRLGQKVDLYHQSISELDIDKKFDVIYSRGGAWTFVSNQSDRFLASHLFNTDEIKRSFDCVANHLKEGGVLIISASNAYGDNLVKLDNGIVHKRISNTEIIDSEKYAILDYLFYRGDELLAEQKLKLRLLDYQIAQQMLGEVGFSEKDTSNEKYYVFTKNA